MARTNSNPLPGCIVRRCASVSPTRAIVSAGPHLAARASSPSSRATTTLSRRVVCANRALAAPKPSASGRGTMLLMSVVDGCAVLRQLVLGTPQVLSQLVDLQRRGDARAQQDADRKVSQNSRRPPSRCNAPRCPSRPAPRSSPSESRTRSGSRLDVLQHLNAIHLGHHHIQQDEIEIVQPQLLECFFPEAAVKTL